MMEEDELLKWVEDIDGAICGDDRFTDHVLARAKKLKVISKWGTGTDSIDREAAARRGIQVCNTPDAFSHGVADSVLGYMLCFARRLPEMNAMVRAGMWEKISSVSLTECTLGVIGVGNVGKQVVRRAKGFGMRLVGNDIISIPADFIGETGIEMITKEALLQQSDFVSLNCDLNPTSFHLIGDRELGQMKKTAYLINTARGPIIDEPSLARALEAKAIAGAALDVFEVEPLPHDSPLMKFENVLLAPHNSNSSPKAWEFVHQNTFRNLLKGLGIEHG
jgi:D-3-phosphoglycerate dehydrogenase